MIINPESGHGTMACPKCGSRHIQLQATGRKTGVVIGGAAGAGVAMASGITATEVAAAAGAVVVRLAGRLPATPAMGAALVAIAGFLWGARLGHLAGKHVDEKVLGLHRCLDCGTEFSA